MTATVVEQIKCKCGGDFAFMTQNRFRLIEKCKRCGELRTQWTLKLWRQKVGETPIDNARVAKAEAKRARRARLRRLIGERRDDSTETKNG